MSIRPKLVKGYLVNEDNKDTLLFQYNPESYYTEHGAKYEEIESPGASYRNIAYVGRSVERFPLTLQFYGVNNVVSGKTANDKGKSSTDIENYLMNLTKPSKTQLGIIKGSNHFISPPICTLVIGGRVWSTVIENVKLLRKMFNQELKTMQLEATVNFIVLKSG